MVLSDQNMVILFLRYQSNHTKGNTTNSDAAVSAALNTLDLLDLFHRLHLNSPAGL